MFIKIISILLSLSVGLPAVAQPATGGSTAREYYSSNNSRRLTVKVQVWGEVPLSGIHHVPDDTTLLDLISYAGGPKGKLSSASIIIKRASEAGKTYTYEGDKILQTPHLETMVMKTGDIVYVNIDTSDQVMRNLTLVSSITGVISSLMLTYLVARDRL